MTVTSLTLLSMATQGRSCTWTFAKVGLLGVLEERFIIEVDFYIVLTLPADDIINHVLTITNVSDIGGYIIQRVC